MVGEEDIGEKSALVSSLLTFISAIIKLVGGWITRTGVLIADGVHGIIDTVETFSSYIGIKLVKIGPTERFPYGLYKAENLITMFICFFIFLAAYELITEGFEKFNKITGLSLIISVISIMFSIVILAIQYIGAKRSGMESLKAVATESIFDLIVSLVGFTIIFLKLVKYQYYAILFIVGLIVIFGSRLLYSSILSLLDISPGREFIERVRKEIEEINGVKEVKDIRLRRAGPYILGDVTITTLPGISVDKAHEIADEVERRLRKLLKYVVVHVEPYKGRRVIAIPIDENGKISNVFSRSPKFLIINHERKVVDNPHKNKKVRAGIAVAKFLKNLGVDTVLVKEIGSVGFHSLRDLFIEVYKVSGENPEEEVQKFYEGKLEKLQKETRERI